MHLDNDNMMVNIVWPKLKLSEKMDNGVFDDLLYYKLIIIVDDVDVENTDEIIRKLNLLYTDPAHNYTATISVGGVEYQNSAFHYSLENLQAPNIGGVKKYYLDLNQFDNPKFRLYQYECISSYITCDKDKRSNTVMFSMCWIKDLDDDDKTEPVEIMAQLLSTLCHEGRIDFNIYSCTKKKCDIKIGNDKINIKKKYKFIPEKVISPQLREEVLQCVDNFYRNRRFYFDPREGLARSTRNRHDVADLANPVNSELFKNTLLWNPILGAKNGPEALSRALTHDSGKKRQASTLKQTMNANDNVSKSLFPPDNTRKANLEKELQLKTQQIEALKKQLSVQSSSKSKENKDLSVKIKELNAREKELKAREKGLGESSNKPSKDTAAMAKLREENEKLRDKLEKLKSQNYDSGSSSQSTKISSTTITCNDNPHDKMLSDTQKLLQIENINLEIQKKRSQVRQTSDLEFMSSHLLKKQILYNDTKDFDRKRKRDNQIEDEERQFRLDEIVANNEHKRKMEAFKLQYDCQASLIKTSNENDMFRSLVASQQRHAQPHNSIWSPHEDLISSSRIGNECSNHQRTSATNLTDYTRETSYSNPKTLPSTNNTSSASISNESSSQRTSATTHLIDREKSDSNNQTLQLTKIETEELETLHAIKHLEEEHAKLLKELDQYE